MADRVSSKNGATLTVQPDGSIQASGANPESDVYSVVAKTTLRDITAIRIEVFADKALSAGGPGRSPNGNFVLTQFEVAREGKPWQGAQKIDFSPPASLDQVELAHALLIEHATV